MKILIIGSGGREHALAWKLAQSKKVEKIFAAPGNGGTAVEEKTENLSLDSALNPDSGEGQNRLLEFARRENVDMTVVGPEAPLAAGIVDRFRGAGLAIVGPDQNAARLETSKVYAKSFMAKYGVRTAKSRKFTNLAEALEYTEKHFTAVINHNLLRFSGSAISPLVIKADGLASGKGVVITADLAEAKRTLEAFMKEGALGEAGKSVVLEEYLEGREVSILAAVSVSNASSGVKKGVIKPFIAARDHKRRFEGGLGPNTGGMGAISPVPDFTADIQKDFENAILDPTLKGMKAEEMDYQGFIFFGVMVSKNRCYLLEYNARLGDPETQAVLPLMDSDLAELCEAILNGSLADFSIKWKAGTVCAPVAVADGYPGPYRKGEQIAINAESFRKTGALLFIAGACREAPSSALRTSGGRVLAVSAHGGDIDDARKHAYEALRLVSFEGMAYRKDIGREEKKEENVYG